MSSNKSIPGNETPPYATFLEAVNTVIQANLSDWKFSIDQLADTLHLSRMQLHRKLKATAGISTSLYIRKQRLKAAKKILLSTDWNIYIVARKVGFLSASYFTRCFVGEFGVTPSDFRLSGGK